MTNFRKATVREKSFRNNLRTIHRSQRGRYGLIAALALAACAPESNTETEAELLSAGDDQGQAALVGSRACERLAEMRLADTSVNEAAHLQTSERQIGPPDSRVVRLPVPHCKVVGVTDSTVNFELLLPDAWNGKFLMGGGGGFVGEIQNQAQDGLSGGLTPLERGYATVGTDTGHVGSALDGSWALNDEDAKDKFAHRAVHRTAEVSKRIIEEYYRQDIGQSYFLGCSRGGGQAMISAQRYPRDFDGIIAGAPALDWTGIGAGFIRNQQFVLPDPNQSPVITQANRELLARSLRDTCDALDGVADNILSDPQTCAFDPADLPICEGVPDATCLTEAQLTAIQTIYDGPNVAGKQLHPGFPFGGETDPGGWELWIAQASSPRLPQGIPNLHYAFGTGLFKYFIYSDPAWSYAGYDFQDYEEVSAETAALLNATDPDLSEFRDGGGKLILWHGWSDSALTALDSIDYYESVKEQDSAVEDYFRMYLLPGVGHCAGGPGPDEVDWITVIEQWVENDRPPQELTAAKDDEQGNQIMERLLCPHPQSAQYDGVGDANVPDSYECAVLGQ